MSLKPVPKPKNLKTYLPKKLDTWKVDTHQWACKGMQSGFKWLK